MYGCQQVWMLRPDRHPQTPTAVLHVARALESHGLEKVAHAVLLPRRLVPAARVHHQPEGAELTMHGMIGLWGGRGQWYIYTRS